MKLFSVDAETDGLYGKVIAIGAIVRIDEKEIARFEGRIPIEKIKDPWVCTHVVPQIRDMTVYTNSIILEERFWDFWMRHRHGAIAVTHCGSPVESGLFRRCVEHDLEERRWKGPYPCLHDVGTLLFTSGEDESSVDEYIKKYQLKIPFEKEPHNPVYDAIATAIVWEDLTKMVNF